MSAVLPSLDRACAEKAPGSGDSFFAAGIVAILAVLVIPLPKTLLDFLLTLNISLALLILLTSLKVREPLEFSTFPSILLFATLFRLALNVASARLILLDGDAGAVIHAFGDFVVGGNFFVGSAIFLILIVVQFVVITKGASRVSEVAARFTLDALPGKQMAIDADLNAGLIGEDEARDRRARVQREAEFHGAMDGSSKFVRGDAIAGLLILGINILGGLVVGLRRGLGIEEALRKYAILTVGDGLVTQVPALLISTAAGVVVVKASSRTSLSHDLAFELFGRPRVLATLAAMVFVLALVPGLPALPFAAAAAAASALHFARRKGPGEEFAPSEAKREKKAPPSGAPDAGDAAGAEQIRELLQVDRVTLELGIGLVAMADSARAGTLIERIALLRKQIASDWGWVFPTVRVKENLALAPGTYRILLASHEVSQGTIEPGRYLAIGGATAAPGIEGIPTVDPSFGLPALWICERDRALAEIKGYTVVDPTTVLITHLGEVLRSHAAEILTRDDVQALLDNLKKQAPAVVNELVPALLSLGDIEKVLAALLREQVSIRNLQAILEALADQAPKGKEKAVLVEAARQRVARAVLAPHLDESGKLFILTLDPRIERRIAEGLARPEGGPPIEGAFLHALVERIALEVRRAVESPSRREPVLVVETSIRRHMADLLRQALPRLAVLSYAEIAAARRVESIGTVKLAEAA